MVYDAFVMPIGHRKTVKMPKTIVKAIKIDQNTLYLYTKIPFFGRPEAHDRVFVYTVWACLLATFWFVGYRGHVGYIVCSAWG